ncbi:hypothetical protein F4809DRAFT_637750 [Biscogniauxia mediterranea]|nr:hypothetical protein F4809DRAFT_637750 [Biscogniauxia mediterranea]
MSITYTCHNEPKYGTVPRSILAQLPSDGAGRTRCPDCRTATAAGMLSLLRRMAGGHDDDDDARYAAVSEAPDRLLEYLFSRAAAQRKSAGRPHGYKEGWGAVCAAWALAAVRLASPPQLRALCAALRIRWGSGLERTALQALGAALMRRAGVDAYLGDGNDANATMAVTYNASVDLLADLLARTETFRQLETLRHSVAGVRRLRDATVDVCALLDGALAAACEGGRGRRPSTAGGR